MSEKNERSTPVDFPIGTRVIVLRNPHDSRAEGVAGSVVAIRHGQGLQGVDLFDVRYEASGQRDFCTFPFAASCLAVAPPGVLSENGIPD